MRRKVRERKKETMTGGLAILTSRIIWVGCGLESEVGQRCWQEVEEV